MRFEIDFLESQDAESMLAELRRVAALLGKDKVTVTDLAAHGRVTHHALAKQFGGMRKALVAAGLKPSRFRNASDDELLDLVAELWTITLRESGRRPRTSDVEKYGIPVAAATIIRRFGSWKRALMATANRSKGEAAPEPVKTERRRRIPVRKRFLVLKRDRYQCRLCRRPGGELEVDHIVPLNQGGSDRLDNLQTLCRECNRGKGDSLE